MSRSSVSPAELLAGGNAVHWLVDAEIGGYPYRASDEDVAVLDANGTTYNYRAGLGDDFVSVVRADGDTSAQITLSADVQGTPDGWPSVLVAAPHGSRVTIRRWVEGQTLNEARVILSGAVFDCDYDDEDAPLSLSIRWLDQTPIAVPPPQAVISTETWPATGSATPDLTNHGATYPLVFGTPGYRDEVAWGATVKAAYSTPAYMGQLPGGAAVHSTGRLVLGWVPDGTSYHATTATLFLEHDDATSSNGRGYAVQSLTVSTTADLLGRVVATCAPGGYTGQNTTIRFRPGKEYWVRWNGGGGVYNEGRSGPMRKAGEIIAYLLRLAGLDVDQGRMAVARGRLDRYLLDFALVESQDDIRQFIEKEIGALIPLVRRTSENGIWYEALNYFPRPEDAVLHLVVPDHDDDAASYRETAVTALATTVLVERASTISYTDEPVTNTLTLRYAFARGAEHTQQVVVTGEEPDSAAAEIGSFPAAASLARYGTRAGAIVNAKMVHDQGTAELMAIELAARAAKPRRLCAFMGDVADLECLEAGDVVRVTDTARGITDAFALVMALESSLTQVTASLELLDHLP